MNSIIRIVVVIKSSHNPTAIAVPEGTFQVASVYGYDENEHEADLTSRLDANTVYKSAKDVAKDLGLHLESMTIEEEYEEL